MKGALIGQGRTAEIYAWLDGQVLKLFRSDMPADWVTYEHEVASQVHAAGVNCPAVFGPVVEVEGRHGIVYEKVAGESLLKVFSAQPWRLVELARLMAELHAQMHGAVSRVLPSQRERLRKRIGAAPYLSEPTKARLWSRLDSLPDDDKVCHGDFHLDNVLLDGLKASIIDWTDATRGNALADVARTMLVLSQRTLPPGVGSIQGMGINAAHGVFRQVYWRRYSRLWQVTLDQVNGWLPVVAAARLVENISTEEEALIRLAESVV